MKFLILAKDQIDQDHILTGSYEKKSSDAGDYVTIPHRFREFWQYLLCNFGKELFLSGVIV